MLILYPAYVNISSLWKWRKVAEGGNWVKRLIKGAYEHYALIFSEPLQHNVGVGNYVETRILDSYFLL